MTLVTSSDHLTLSDYFRRELEASSEHLQSPPQTDTLWYLGSLMARFSDSEELFGYDAGEVSIRPLALLYKDAHEAQNTRERCLILRQLGDLALFMGALFPGNFTRRGIHKDYFVGMGGGAYDYLSENAHQNRHIFSELATTFVHMLELIALACSRERVFDAEAIVQLYRRWQLTGDERLARQLRTLGVEVVPAGEWH
ncbi:hypothetical protein [Marinimicrobium alkaliphilum]|uniref:hypothetical protein n=1 Tax=Marinimicrobium alkaliphilum TaxID=2202654 RepID=UPI000DBA026F|nr:hypothetical protein [Marinimicrobium alkaliphilum]